VPDGQVEILSIKGLAEMGPWVASESLDLGAVERADAPRNGAEALFRLLDVGEESQTVEPLYVEGPPVHVKA
jgi:hypothetical protein